MVSRTAFRLLVPLALGIVVTASPDPSRGQGPRAAFGQQTTGDEPRPEGGPAAPVRSEDEKAIRAADDAFVADYNKADSKALAARFTEDAEVAEVEGDHYQGRDLIEGRLASTFAASPGVKIELAIDAIRFVSPDVAKEEGRSRVTPATGAPESRRYTVIYVKRDGRWLISSVREELDPLVRPHDRLKDLEWMVGDWVDEGSDSVVRLVCRWSEDENFLTRKFTVRQQGKPVMTVHQRIGWDPLARQIRSWEFDSEGGFGEGKWSRADQRWVIKHEGVRPEGTTASATNIMTQVRSDLIRWVSTERILGDESVPVDETYVLVRIPPPPQFKFPGEATAPPSPNSPRTPR